MHVRSAHGHGSNFEQDVIVSYGGHCDFPELDRERLERVLNDGGLGPQWSSVSGGRHKQPE